MPSQMAVLALVCGVIDMLANVLYLLAHAWDRYIVERSPRSIQRARCSWRGSFWESDSNWLQRLGVGCALAAVVLIVSGGR